MAADPHNFPGSIEDFEKKQRIQQKNPQKPENKKFKFNLAFPIIATFIALDAGVFTFFSTVESDVLKNSEYWYLLSAFPFLLIITIAIIVGRKKAKKDFRTQTMTAIIIIAVMGVALAGLAVYFLASLN